MRTITITLEAELQFAAVAAACPPALPVPQQASAWRQVQQQEQSGRQTGIGTGTSGVTGGIARGTVGGTTLAGALGASTALGAVKALSPDFAGAVNSAKPAGLADTGRTDLYRPFHTMSRRDPRSWRPPHSD